MVLNLDNCDFKEGTLPSQKIRELFDNGIIEPSADESKIQPASLDPTLSNKIFSLDSSIGVFRPKWDKKIEDILKTLPNGAVREYSLEGGFELRRGFTYLIPLNEKLSWAEDIFIRSSPKSSFGRLFLNTRLLADYNYAFDEVQLVKGRTISLWLLVQPLAFNIILYPNMSLNQLRFFYKSEGRLPPSELKSEFSRNKLVDYQSSLNKWVKDSYKTLYFWDGVRVHLDLANSPYAGLIARKVWEPIDTSKLNYYKIEDYFDVVLSKDNKVKLEPGSYALFRSKEFLMVPPHLSSELRSHSYLGINATLHFAGFIDNGFNGQLVLEVHSNELSPVILEDSMPISKLDFYRTLCVPDKIYGRSIGSHYSLQRGVKVAKFFKADDFR